MMVMPDLDATKMSPPLYQVVTTLKSKDAKSMINSEDVSDVVVIMDLKATVL